MYLTQITTDGISLAKQRLFDAYRWHQELSKVVSSPRFRMYESTEGMKVLLLSMEAPKIQPWGEWQIKQIPETFYDGARYVFSLRANPTVRKRDGKTKNGHRLAVRDQEDLTGWLNRKAQESGFEIETVNIILKGSQISTKKGKTIVQNAVEFDGLLKVVDKEKFKSTAWTGIGPAKGFGFGLLLLKRA